ncbi:hypothetical protein CLOM_g13513, partial [Closterium sp. NIES-68]
TLATNQITGYIPADIGLLTQLVYISLHSNMLSGSIPASITKLTALTSLSLYSNQLNGSIPADLGLLSRLVVLHLAGNQLTGSIPANIGLMTRLVTIDFSTNQLSGSIPTSVGSLAQLTLLYLFKNQLMGSIPAEIGSMTNLAILDFSTNQLSGSIPTSVGSLAQLTLLHLFKNQLMGSIPAEIGSMTNLAILDISSNKVSGSIPASVGALAQLTWLKLNNNQLTTSIPAEIGYMTKLVVLGLSSNQLSGSIPASLGRLTQLTIVTFRDNMLSGSLPFLISGPTALITCDLSYNHLSGPIPEEIAFLTALTVLVMSQNELNGSIPESISSLVSLRHLSLSWNKLTGSVPALLSSLAKLTTLELQSNLLTGRIPDSLGELSQLRYLSLSFNQLYGSIPGTVTKLTQLTYFGLSHNYLTGPAVTPVAASRLDLSNNFLSGPLPEWACQALSFDANCFALPDGCASVLQRQEAACNAFCGVSTAAVAADITASAAIAGCGGHGVCYPDGTSFAPTCLCDAGFVQFQQIKCVAQGQNKSYSTTQQILPPATMLTKGTQRETSGKFTTAPATLFVFEAGQAVSRCGVQLAFHANFTFSLSPQSGRVGFNGFAFVVSAKDQVGVGSGVGYGGMDNQSMAIEFDTLQNKQHGDMSGPHVGLNIRGQDKSIAAVRSPFPLSSRRAYTAWVDYEPGDPGTIQVFLGDTAEKPVEALLERRVALCEVLQAGAEQQAFFFGFVASTTVKPFQKHVILSSAMSTGKATLMPAFLILPSQAHVTQARNLVPWCRMVVSQQPLANGLSLTAEAYMPVWASPFPRYASADYRVSANKQDAWVVSDFHSWDSVPFLGWPVKNQFDCNACWAFALVGSIEAAYGIAVNQEAPRLSVDSLFAAMGLTSETDKCSTGGSPTEAFERLLTMPRGGITEASKPQKKYPIHGFERTRFKGYVGLMLTVRRQPVVVHIEASAASFAQYDGSFKYQDPGCYTGRLNHVVLVIGYFVLRNDGSQNRIAPPFWIIRNSWGVEWGDRGHMHMDIQGGDGVCGINVLPGIYPIVKISGDPCGQKSFKGDGDLQPSMNPCGRFTCRANPRSNSNTCNCSVPNEPKQPFIEVANGYGFKTCAYVDVCGSNFKNPCYVGTCINDGKGSYSCICPPNHVESKTVDGFPTCDPANTTASTIAVGGSNWWCSDLTIVGILLAEFMERNPAVDCRQPLPRDMVLQLGSTLVVPCTAFFYTLNGDTCSSIGTQLGLTATDLAALNPGLDCSEPIKAGRSLCLERNATFAFTVPQCVKFGVLTAQDTCERLLLQVAGSEDNTTGAGKVNATRWAELYRNNPGLICSNVIPVSASAVGSNTGVQICLRADYWSFVVGVCKKGRQKPVSPSLTCAGAYRFYGGAQNGAISKFYIYNEKTCVGAVGSRFICVP